MGQPTTDRLFAITSRAFASRAKAGRASAECLIVDKAVNAMEVKAEDGGGYSFTVSTPDQDRAGDTVALGGWKLDAFRANPVLLLAHDYRQMPVGSVGSVGVEGAALVARGIQLLTTPRAAEAQAALDGGALRAVSPGFRPLKWAYNEDTGGVDYLEQELLEVSLCAVPMHQAALRLALGEDEDVPAVGRALDLLFAISKAGRTLSAANEARIRAARASGSDLCTVLDEVLAQLDEQAKAVPAPALVSLSKADVQAAMTAAVQRTVNAAVRRLTGRLED